MPIIFSAIEDVRAILCLLANLASLSLDFIARQKLGGMNLTFGYMNQFAVLPPARLNTTCPWQTELSVKEWLFERILRLVYVSADMRPFAESAGIKRPPYNWNNDQRRRLRAEVDAAYFYLYGMNSETAAYVMENFAVLRENEISRHGVFRTKKDVLSVLEKLEECVGNRSCYESEMENLPETLSHGRH